MNCINMTSRVCIAFYFVQEVTRWTTFAVAVTLFNSCLSKDRELHRFNQMYFIGTLVF